MIETVTLGWIDDGEVEGKFAASVVHLLMQKSLPLLNLIQVTGKNNATDKNSLINRWIETCTDEWLLMVEPDAVIYPESIEKMWKSVKEKNIKVMSGLFLGIYEQTILVPTVYNLNDDGTYTMPNIAKNTENKIDAFDFGCILIHRDVILKIMDTEKTKIFFKDEFLDDFYMGHTFSFFRLLKKINVQPYVHSGVILDRIKKIMINSSDQNILNIKNIF